MIDDPIVEEVHRIREQMLAEYGGDLSALIQDMRRRTEESARGGRLVVSSTPKPSQPPQTPPRKVG